MVPTPKYNAGLFRALLKARMRWGQVTRNDIHTSFLLSADEPQHPDVVSDELLPGLVDQLVDDGWRVER